MLTLLAMTAVLAVAPAPAPADDFARLAALAGHWRGTAEDNRVIDIRYRLIANGSALIEEWTSPRGNQTMTVYYRDGDRVMATHFCGQGNQPRLVLAAPEGDWMRFAFQDATNLAPGKSHLHAFWIEIASDGTMRRAETYSAGPESETETMVLRRVTPSP
ncbi:hypothetical protein ABS767_15020 [Sphingomonas sp. ST-64]|uniref:DUF1579 domain-containing protein n=1 Tax=Sphingomonas plantiphila TaxID=3163295 RepID=A0ABW8YSZ2_9SPHN